MGYEWHEVLSNHVPAETCARDHGTSAGTKRGGKISKESNIKAAGAPT